MKIKTSNLDELPLDYVMTSILDPDGLKYGVEDWRQQHSTFTNSSGEYLHRYQQNWNLLGPTLRECSILVGPSPFPGAEFAAGIGNEWDTCQHIMTGPSYEVAICRTIVASEKGQEVEVPIELFSLADLKRLYVEAARRLHEPNCVDENQQAFMEVNDALHNHPQFQGGLPEDDSIGAADAPSKDGLQAIASQPRQRSNG